MRSLVVEDNLTNRQLLLKLLSPFGETEVAVDGKEAVEIVYREEKLLVVPQSGILLLIRGEDEDDVPLTPTV